jgi:D-hexose-6-phosphate mutarotase
MVEKQLPKEEQNTTKAVIKENNDTLKVENSLNEVMEEDEILFNGKLKRYFTIKEFEKVFVKADSIKQLAKEEPCTFIFDTELKNDNSNINEFLYYYKEGSRFENYKKNCC